MPYVNIKITDENVTKEQKLRLIQGATQLLNDFPINSKYFCEFQV
jgi:4-oxalocrotonate tautomerase